MIVYNNVGQKKWPWRQLATINLAWKPVCIRICCANREIRRDLCITSSFGKIRRWSRQILFPTEMFKGSLSMKNVRNWKGVVFHQDNVRFRISLHTWRKWVQLGWDILLHSPYTLDLSSSDYDIFRSLQNSLNEKNSISSTIITKSAHFKYIIF